MTRRHSHLSTATMATIIGIALVAAACSSGATSTTSIAPTTAPTTAPVTTVALTSNLTPGRHVETFVVAGVTRTAIVVVPASLTKPAPLVFVFHGHGGTGANIERKFRIETLWPEAIVVYPYGLVGHKGKTDPQGVKSGWQTAAGEDGDRDLKFYDTMLATFRHALPVDNNRIFAMGHSNGSAFVSLLLNKRGISIAATANLSGQPSAHQLATDPTRSMFMAMGRTDPLVPFANQERAIPIAEKKLGIDPGTAKVSGYLRTETGCHGLELDTYIYPGGHEPPPAVPPLIVAFFRRHTLSNR